MSENSALGVHTQQHHELFTPRLNELTFKGARLYTQAKWKDKKSEPTLAFSIRTNVRLLNYWHFFTVEWLALHDADFNAAV